MSKKTAKPYEPHLGVKLAVGTNIGRLWKVEKLLGEGACGRVYAVESRSSVSEQHGFKLAAKLIPNGDGMSQRDAKEQKKISNTLNLERQYLAPGQLLNNSRDKFQYCTRLPPTDYHGADSALCMDYLVMERFDQDLTSWATRNSPSVSEIASVGLQILDGLQWLHNKAYLFIDIKPDNFMLQGENIKFIDFGLMERFVGHSGIMRDDEACALKGTPTYLSVRVTDGATPSRNDELEALCFMLLSLANKCALPWSNSGTHEQLAKMKRECDVLALAKSYGCPELGEMINVCRGTGYSASPNYEQLKTLLAQMKLRRADTPKAKNQSGLKSSTRAPAPAVAEPMPEPPPPSLPHEEGEPGPTTSRRRQRNVDPQEKKVAPKRGKVANAPASYPPPPPVDEATGPSSSSAPKPPSGPFALSAGGGAGGGSIDYSFLHSPVRVPTVLMDTAFATATAPAPTHVPVRTTPIKAWGPFSTLEEGEGAVAGGPPMERRRSSRLFSPLSSSMSASASRVLSPTASKSQGVGEGPFSLALRVVDGPHSGDILKLGSSTDGSDPPASKEEKAPGGGGGVRGKAEKPWRGRKGASTGVFHQRVLGRAGDIQMPLDECISESHLRVLWTWVETSSGRVDLDLSVQDKASLNGTTINGGKLKHNVWIRLYDGDTIKIGQSELVVEVTALGKKLRGK